MKFICSILVFFYAVNAFGDSKLSIDIAVDKLDFKKPQKGVGKAGSLIFKYANIINNGIVLNINNVNNFFDSQIFVRPTFLGFTTQFGNYGFSVEESSMLNKINQTELQNGKLVLDDSELNLSGQYFSFINNDSSMKLKNFLLYCQSNTVVNIDNGKSTEVGPTNDIIKNCFNFMSLNGLNTAVATNPEIEFTSQKNGDKTYFQSQVKTFDLRKTLINADLINLKIVSNDNYIISTKDIKLDCDKDADLTELDFEKIKKTCSNRLKLNPLKATLIDTKQKTNFNLDANNIVIKDKLIYVGLNSVSMSNDQSTTYLNNVLFNCKKEIDSDLFEVTQVLRDCFTYGRLSIGEIKSDSKLDPKKESSNKNLVINADAGNLVIQAQVRFLGSNHPVVIYGKIGLDEVKKQIIITVTETKLPFGITSVKLLMYFIKKDFISKDIQVNNNVITIGI